MSTFTDIHGKEKEFIPTSVTQKRFNDRLDADTLISRFKTLTDKELFDYEAVEQEWLIEDILLPRTLMVIGAPTFSCKSWIGIDIAHCVANGLPLFGKFKTAKKKVLYVDRENGKPELKKRQRMIRGAHELSSDSEIAWMSEEDFKLDSDGGAKVLEMFIKANDIGLVIFDTYRRMVSYREDKADDVSRFIDDLIKPVCYRTGVSMIFIHHESKGKDKSGIDRLRGSSDLANNVESVLQLSKEGDYLNIVQTKVRGGAQIKPFSLKIETDEVSYYKLNYKGESAYRSPAEKCAQDLVLWYSGKGLLKFHTSEALAALNVQRSKFYDAIGLLRSKGIIKNTGRGSYEVGDRGNSMLVGLSSEN